MDEIQKIILATLDKTILIFYWIICKKISTPQYIVPHQFISAARDLVLRSSREVSWEDSDVVPCLCNMKRHFRVRKPCFLYKVGLIENLACGIVRHWRGNLDLFSLWSSIYRKSHMWSKWLAIEGKLGSSCGAQQCVEAN